MIHLLAIALMWFFYFVGSHMLGTATEIAIRRETNVWTASRPEFGAALLFWAMAALIAYVGLSS